MLGNFPPASLIQDMTDKCSRWSGFMVWTYLLRNFAKIVATSDLPALTPLSSQFQMLEGG